MNPTQIKNRILQDFDPSAEVKVIDERGDQYHIKIEITSSKFNNLSRVEQNKLIYNLFSAELSSGIIHALSLKLTSKNA